MKRPWGSHRLLLNILLVLNAIAYIWADAKDLFTLQFVLGIFLLAQIVFRWCRLGPNL